MHELGIVFHIIDTLEEVGKDNELSQIQRVTMEVGEVSTVIPEYLIDCWNWAVKRNPPCCRGVKWPWNGWRQ